MNMLSNQLPLPVALRDDATFDNYICSDRFVSGRAMSHSSLLVDQLRRQLTGGERYLYLYGNKGCGCSHLLQAACHYADQLGFSAMYLPLFEVRHYAPSELFDSLDQLSLVCLDDLQAIVGSIEWEEALFHLFNHLAANSVALLVSANGSVRTLPWVLADLASRLSSGAVYHVAPPSMECRLTILQCRAHQRGIKLSSEVAQFIYYRCQRDMGALMTVLDRLDQASLTAQRRLTIPFVKAVMGW